MEDAEPSIRPLEVADAASLVACIRRCYGETYPGEGFDDVGRLAERIASGRLRSVVAVAPDGAVVGHMGLSLGADGGLTAEAGNTAVDPEHRGHHLAARLAVALMALAREGGLVGFHHYPTTAHPVMQKLSVQGNGVETGVLLDYIPGGTRYLGFAGRAPEARVAVVAIYEPLAPAPARRVWLPPRHRQLGRWLYARAGFERDLADDASALPPAPAELGDQLEERRGLLRIAVERLGADLAAQVESRLQARPDVPVLVDLPLDEPAAPAACEALAGLGLFYGALLPEYRPTGDVLRLQRPAAGIPALDLATPGGRALLAYSERDRDASS